MTIGILASDATGAFAATIETLPAATAGHYQLTVAVVEDEALAGQSAVVGYTLDQAAPLRAKESSPYNLLVPLDVLPANNSTIFLPIMWR